MPDKIEMALTRIRQRLGEAADPSYRQQIERLVPGVRTIGVRVPVIRGLAKVFSVEHKDWAFADRCLLLDRIARQASRDEMLFGVFLIGQDRKSLITLSWPRILTWLNGVDNWETCDQLAAVVAAPVLASAARSGQTDPASALLQLTKEKVVWKRRFALSVGVALNQKGRKEYKIALQLCEALVNDPEPMVQKTLAWILREVSDATPDAVGRFLEKYKAVMPPKIVRDASEKLPEPLRRSLKA